MAQADIATTHADQPPDLPIDLAQADTESSMVPFDVGSPCVDTRSDCAALARANLSACGEAPVMLSQCTATCKACGYKKLLDEVLCECRDTHNECQQASASNRPGRLVWWRRRLVGACSGLSKLRVSEMWVVEENQLFEYQLIDLAIHCWIESILIHRLSIN